MAIFPIKKKPEKKTKVQDNGEFLHQIDIELIVGTYLNSNDITMTDENHKKLLEEALSYFHETLDDYDLRGAEDYMSAPEEYQFLFRDAKEADILEDDIIGFVENYNVEDKIQDNSDEERADLIYEYETKIAKAKRKNDTETQYYYQDKLDELLREEDMNVFVEDEDNEDTLDDAKIQDEELTVRNLLTKKGSFDVTNDYADDFAVGYDGEEEFPLTPEGEEYFTDVLDLKVDFNDNAVVLINHLDNAEEVAKKVSQLFRGLTGILKDEYDKYFVLFADDKLQDNEIPFETIFWGIYDNEFDLPFDKTVEYIHEKYADKIWQDENADGDLSALTAEEEQDIIEFAKDEALNWDSVDIYNSHARYKSDEDIKDQLEKYFGIKNTKMQDNKINIPDLLKKEIEALGDKSRKADLDKAIATVKANKAYPMVYDVYVGSLIKQEKDNLLNTLGKNKDLTVFDYGGMFKVLTKEDELKLMEA